MLFPDMPKSLENNIDESVTIEDWLQPSQRAIHPARPQ